MANDDICSLEFSLVSPKIHHSRSSKKIKREDFIRLLDDLSNITYDILYSYYSAVERGFILHSAMCSNFMKFNVFLENSFADKRFDLQKIKENLHLEQDRFIITTRYPIVSGAIESKSIPYNMNAVQKLYLLVSNLVATMREKGNPKLCINDLVEIANSMRGRLPEIEPLDNKDSSMGFFIAEQPENIIEIPVPLKNKTILLTNRNTDLSIFNAEELREIAIYIDKFSSTDLFDVLRLDVAKRRVFLKQLADK